MKELLFKNKFRFLLYIFACLLPIFTHLSTQYIFSVMLGSIGESVTSGNFSFFLNATILSLILTLIGSLLYLFSRFMRIRFMRDTILDVRLRSFLAILKKTYMDFSSISKDIYTSHLVNDINIFEDSFFYSFMNLVYNTGLYTVSLIILAIMDVKFALMVFVFSLTSFAIGMLFKKKTHSLKKHISKDYEGFTLNISNIFSGLEIIKLNRVQEIFTKNSISSTEKLQKSKFNYSFFTGAQGSINSFISQFVFLGMFLYVLFSIRSGHNFTSALFMMQLGNSCMRPISKIPPLINEFGASVNIYTDLVKKTDESENEETHKESFIFKKSISVESLSFSYGNKPILTDSSFSIIKGKKYLIRGESGSGKSTLINLLSKTVQGYSGDINIDGVPLKNISQRSFNENVSFIYQDVFLFNDTLINNISLFKDYSEDAIMSSLKRSGLEDFAVNDESGLYKELQENGKNLSGGQRQRVSIARSIIKNSPIIFVDEGTSSLPEDMARSIESMLLSLDSTVLSISHRYYEGITDEFDYVLELRDNKITQYRSHDYFKEVIQI